MFYWLGSNQSPQRMTLGHLEQAFLGHTPFPVFNHHIHKNFTSRPSDVCEEMVLEVSGGNFSLNLGTIACGKTLHVAIFWGKDSFQPTTQDCTSASFVRSCALLGVCQYKLLAISGKRKACHIRRLWRNATPNCCFRHIVSQSVSHFFLCIIRLKTFLTLYVFVNTSFWPSVES